MQLSMVRPWKFSVNVLSPVVGGSGVDTIARSLRTIVNILTGAGSYVDKLGVSTTSPSSPWVVVGSSNGVAAAMDGVNRWVADSDLVWGAGASNKSWIVLRQSGIASQFQILISLDHASKYRLSVIVSARNGFGTAYGGTDGSITARPTATDGVTVLNASDWGINSVATVANRFHVLLSDDGTDTKVLFTRSNLLMGCWSFSIPAVNDASVWTSPSVWMVDGSGGVTSGDYVNRATLMSSSKFVGSIIDPTGCSFMSTAECVGAGAISDVQTIRNEATNKWPIMDIGLYSASPLDTGHHGRHIDLGWSVGAVLNGVKFADAIAGEWVKVGAFTLPWPAGVNIDMTP
jgi:hypothetical protein